MRLKNESWVVKKDKQNQIEWSKQIRPLGRQPMEARPCILVREKKIQNSMTGPWKENHGVL